MRAANSSAHDGRRPSTTELQVVAIAAGLAGLVGCGGLTSYFPADTAEDSGLPTIVDPGTPPTFGDADTDADADADTDVDTDSDIDTDIDLPALDITSVDPPFGSNGGGAVVTIEGGPFDASARVYFGGTEGSVRTVNGTSMDVEVPANSDLGYVNVEVLTDTHYGKSSNAFYYWPDGTGLDGVIGILSYTDFRGNYWSGSPPSDEGLVDTYFIEPQALPEWWNIYYSSSMNTCQSNYTYSGDLTVYVYEPGASALRLTNPTGTTVSLSQDAVDPYYYSTSLTPAQYQSGWWGLQPITGGDWPEFELNQFVYAPPSFNVTSPNIDSASLPNVSRSNLQIRWDGAGGDFVTIELGRDYNGTIAEWVTCTVNDTGSFTVPSGTWTSWNTGQVLYVIVSRWYTGGDNLPFNNANNKMAARYSLYGGGVQAN